MIERMQRGPRRDDIRAWRMFLDYFRPHAKKLFFYAVSASLQSALIVPVFYLVRYVFDVAIPKSSISLLILAGVGIVALRLLNAAIALLLRRFMVGLIKSAITDLRHDLVARLYKVSREFHTHADLSQLHTRIVQDTERMDNIGNSLFSGMLPAALSALVLLIALFVMSWSLTLMMIAIAPAIWFALRMTGRRVRREVHAFQRAFEAFSNGILFVVRQMDLTRILAHEAGEIRRQQGIADRLRTTGIGMAMSFAFNGQVQQVLMGAAGAAILIAGGVQVAIGAMSLGELLAFYVAAGLLNGSANTVLAGFADVVAGTESLGALRTLADAGPLDPYHGSRRITLKGDISIRHVAFDYGEHSVLHDINLELGPAARIAIIGANGAGKTTLLNLIIGFERPRAGEIRADGIAYDEVDMPALRRQIGVVTQNMTFFSGTIAENIGYGRPHATRSEIAAAARLALADDFISALPNGYDTQVGESGHLLSGGECQRIAIARALLGNPKLLILDEPTNHLDADAIEELGATLATLESRPAFLMISHDPRVMALADRIYRLERGVLVALTGPGAVPAGEAAVAATSI
jgi:ATP-binding cassette, subfamily B, bacterial